MKEACHEWTRCNWSVHSHVSPTFLITWKGFVVFVVVWMLSVGFVQAVTAGAGVAPAMAACNVPQEACLFTCMYNAAFGSYAMRMICSAKDFLTVSRDLFVKKPCGELENQ